MAQEDDQRGEVLRQPERSQKIRDAVDLLGVSKTGGGCARGNHSVEGQVGGDFGFELPMPAVQPFTEPAGEQ